MIEIDNEIFHKNLLITQVYCDLKLKGADNDPATALRTFNPIYDGRKLFFYKVCNRTEGDFISANWSKDPLKNNSTLYPDLFERQLTHKKDLVDLINSTEKFEGRILVADVEETVIDGASEMESQGFVDINDCPPIDTWFYKTWNKNRWIFFTWVPQQFVEFADKAVAVNCVDCISWYEDWLLREKTASIKFKQAGSKISFLKHINKLFGK